MKTSNLMRVLIVIGLISSPAWAKPAGKLVGWGNNEYGQTDVPSGNDFVAVEASVSGAHSLALRSDGSLAGWGWNYGDSEIGTGDIFYGQAKVPPGNDFKAVAAGACHSLALKKDGSLVGWGCNEAGQTTVPAGNDFVAIAAGDFHSLALKSDGSLVGWGAGEVQWGTVFEPDYGQTDVPAGHDFVAVSAGSFTGFALKSDGSLVAWGLDEPAGLLNVPSGNNFVAIDAGSGHVLALRSDGSMAAWGWNSSGQARPQAGSNFLNLAGGHQHSLALKSDGSLIGWGLNNFGQRTVPVGNGFLAISAGWKVSHAIQAIPGDFDLDGSLTALDIELLSAEIRNLGTNRRFDVNGDSLIDQQDRSNWVHELRRTYFGDANVDGEFNSGDLVAVFGAGQYEDAAAKNSTWSSGDWNGDAEFNTSDLVLAFQDGGYEQGPRASVTGVPEPASWTLVGMAFVATLARRRRTNTFDASHSASFL